MSTTLSGALATDDLTVLLGLVAATVFLLNNLYKPHSLVHPILLGRQSDVGRARNPTESAIYRNYSTGLMGRLPTRPGKDVNVLADLVKAEAEGSRTLWSTKITNSQLQERVVALASGLVQFVGLRPIDSRVFLLLNDGLEFILSDLALASLSIASYTISSTDVLQSVFSQRPAQAIITTVAFLPQLLELMNTSEIQPLNYRVIVVGEVDAQLKASVPNNVQILHFSDVEKNGHHVDKMVMTTPRAEDIFTTSFQRDATGNVVGTQFTHENVLAGVAATRALLPASHTLTALDTVVSAHALSNIYGRVIAYTAIYDGANFATLMSVEHSVTDERIENDVTDVLSYKRCSIPLPTVLFIKSGHLEALASRIHEEASKAFLYSLAMRHKRANIAEGFISKESLWDRLVFDDARATVLGEAAVTLKAVIASELVDGSSQTQCRSALSVPIISCFTHLAVAGPVLASHPYDLQDFPAGKPSSCAAHVGPPSVNMEVKLISVDDDAVESGEDPVGFLALRGPSVGTAIDSDESWVESKVRFRVQTNGTFLPV
jgi:long-chain acyl-CoA synthetase